MPVIRITKYKLPCVPNEPDMDNDFIEDPLVGSITGHVNDEIGGAMNNVIVQLYKDINGDGNADGGPIGSTLTNTSGFYAFTGVEPGNYVVIETTAYQLQ
jgi:hypothetical protein